MEKTKFYTSRCGKKRKAPLKSKFSKPFTIAWTILKIISQVRQSHCTYQVRAQKRTIESKMKTLTTKKQTLKKNQKNKPSDSKNTEKIFWKKLNKHVWIGWLVDSNHNIIWPAKKTTIVESSSHPILTNDF